MARAGRSAPRPEVVDGGSCGTALCDADDLRCTRGVCLFLGTGSRALRTVDPSFRRERPAGQLLHVGLRRTTEELSTRSGHAGRNGFMGFRPVLVVWSIRP